MEELRAGALILPKKDWVRLQEIVDHHLRECSSASTSVPVFSQALRIRNAVHHARPKPRYPKGSMMSPLTTTE